MEKHMFISVSEPKMVQGILKSPDDISVSHFLFFL